MNPSLHLAFLFVSIILAILAAIPPMPYSQSLLAGSLAFLGASQLG